MQICVFGKRVVDESRHLLFTKGRSFSTGHVSRLAYARELNIGHVLTAAG